MTADQNRLLALESLASDLEAGRSVDPAEAKILDRLVSAAAPQRSAAELRSVRDGAIRELAARLGPKTGSVRARERWVRHTISVFESGSDWKASSYRVTCPFPDERRILLWRVRICGELPRERALRDILAG